VFLRTFQIKEFSALDNVALVVQAGAGHSCRFWRDARRNPRPRVPARDALAEVGLEGRDDALASNLSPGEYRQLEIVTALATRPRMFLDEPLAGMGGNESRRMNQASAIAGTSGAVARMDAERAESCVPR
jgi:branched-chain amino acid transport system ATP-binding protein